MEEVDVACSTSSGCLIRLYYYQLFERCRLVSLRVKAVFQSYVIFCSIADDISTLMILSYLMFYGDVVGSHVIYIHTTYILDKEL